MGPHLAYEEYRDGELQTRGLLERGQIEAQFFQMAGRVMTAHRAGASWCLVIRDPEGQVPTINVSVEASR